MTISNGSNSYGQSKNKARHSSLNAEFTAPWPFDRLIEEAGRKLEYSPLHGSSFLVIGFTPEAAAAVREQLQDLGVSGTVTFSNVRKIFDAVKMVPAFNGVIINVDAFDDVDNAIDYLLEFRVMAPRMVVVLVSRTVAVDDFGAERRTIGDVTLRWPVGRQRLKQGLHTGLMRAMNGRA